MVKTLVFDIDSLEQITELREKSSLTFEGVEKNEGSIEFIKDWLDQQSAITGDKLKLYWCSGEQMNGFSQLTKNNAYNDDLNILIVDADCISLEKVVMSRFSLGGRWLDDVMDNNERRERE